MASPSTRRLSPLPSGIRLGSPAATTRGFGKAEFKRVGELIAEVVDTLSGDSEGDPTVEARVRDEVLELTARSPIYA